MKPYLIQTTLFICSLIPVVGLAAEDRFDFSASYSYINPHDGRDWDAASGAEVKAIYWHLEELGWAATIGYQTWDSNPSPLRQQLGEGGGEVTSELSGSATVLPIGISVIYRGDIFEYLTAYLEAGVRYVFIESDLKVSDNGTFDGRGNRISGPESQDIEIGEALTAIVAADLQFPIYRRLQGFVGLGFQFDVLKGEETIGGRETNSETSIQSAFVRAGLYF